jgi:hypothetical protein
MQNFFGIAMITFSKKMDLPELDENNDLAYLKQDLSEEKEDNEEKMSKFIHSHFVLMQSEADSESAGDKVFTAKISPMTAL